MAFIPTIKHAQQQNDMEQRAIALLTEMAAGTNITFNVLCEDVLNVLTNLAANAEAGKGLIAMGGNVNNYTYFLAGLAAIMQKLTDVERPPLPQVADNAIKVLSGLNIVGGLINQNCQKIVDFGAKPENQMLAQKYEQVVKGMKANPAPLVNAIGQLKLAMNKIKLAQPAANTPQTLKTQPVTNTGTQTLPRSTPVQAGSMPPGGAGV